MRLKALSLVISFLLLSIPANSAIPPKPGKPCFKLGLTQIYAGKKYTCYKKGNKLIWNNGVIEKIIDTTKIEPIKSSPTPTPSSAYSPTPSASPTLESNNSQSTSDEKTDSYVTQQRTRNGSGWAAAINSNLSVVWNEDYSSGYKSFRVKIISPQKDGISYDSGLIKDSAQSVTFFISGTICNVIYASEFISYRDLEGEVIANKGRNQEQPRAEGGDCPAYGTKIIPGPMKQPDIGLQSIFSDISDKNELNLRFIAKEFKSYQVTLESQINDDVLWDSKIGRAHV